MTPLNPQQLALIDNYLKTLNLNYFEERLEFTDHIASYIERELSENPNLCFDEVFQDYTLKHQIEIQRNAKKLRRSAFKHVLLRTLKNLFQPIVFLLSLSLFFIYRQIPLGQWNDSLAPLWLTGAIFIGIVLRIFFLQLKTKKYLTIHHLNSMALYVIFYPLLYKPWVDFMSLDDQILMGIVLWMGIAILFTSFKVSSEYKNRYEKGQRKTSIA